MNISILSISAARYADAAQTRIDALVAWSHLPELGELPCTLTLADEAHLAAAFMLCESGEFGPVEGYVAPPEVVHVPVQVARWQAKLALMSHHDQGDDADVPEISLWDRLLGVSQAITDPLQQLRIDAALHEVLNWRRDSPTVAWAGEQLGLSAERVDELFIWADAQVL